MCTTGLPDFFGVNREKCTKWTQNVPNGHKYPTCPVKYSDWPWNISTFFNLWTSKIYPNWNFWSGNPGAQSGFKIFCIKVAKIQNFSFSNIVVNYCCSLCITTWRTMYGVQKASFKQNVNKNITLAPACRGAKVHPP
jgi:hypothetical protein